MDCPIASADVKANSGHSAGFTESLVLRALVKERALPLDEAISPINLDA
jgi:hypothetical protein